MEATGVWSHLACADEPGHPSVERQLARYREALAHAEAAGLRCAGATSANSAAALTLPETHFDLVRPGIAIYGLSPVEGDHGLVPAMTLRATLANVKRVRAGEGVSYGHTYTTDRETTLALVPLGYGDGVPRARLEHRARSRSTAGGSGSAAGSAWTSSWSTSATSRSATATRPCCSAPGTDGEPTCARLGGGARHHPLRDRHPDRGPRPAHVRRARMTDLVLSGGRVLGVDGPDGVVVVRDGAILAVGGPEIRERAGPAPRRWTCRAGCCCPASPTRTSTRSRAASSVAPAT